MLLKRETAKRCVKNFVCCDPQTCTSSLSTKIFRNVYLDSSIDSEC